MAGECSYWACMPTKVLLRPPEAVEGARRAPGARRAVTGDPDVAETLAWRDRIVHGYDDAGQLPWLEERRHRAAARRRVASPGRAACGSATSSTRRTRSCWRRARLPIIPPVQGLRELDGVWTNREATGMQAGPAAAARAGWRRGRRRARADRAAPRRRGRAGRGRRAPARARSRRRSARRWPRRWSTTASSCTSARTRPRRRATGTTTCCGSRTGPSCAATGCSSRPAAARASTTWAWRRSASRPASAASRSTSGCARQTACGRSAT